MCFSLSLGWVCGGGGGGGGDGDGGGVSGLILVHRRGRLSSLVILSKLPHLSHKAYH